MGRYGDLAALGMFMTYHGCCIPEFRKNHVMDMLNISYEGGGNRQWYTNQAGTVWDAGIEALKVMGQQTSLQALTSIGQAAIALPYTVMLNYSQAVIEEVILEDMMPGTQFQKARKYMTGVATGNPFRFGSGQWFAAKFDRMKLYNAKTCCPLDDSTDQWLGFGLKAGQPLSKAWKNK